MFSIPCNRITPRFYGAALANLRVGAHPVRMRIVPLLMLIGATCCSTSIRASEFFGIWKANLVRSTNPYAGGLVIRFEPHIRGEVFTVGRTDGAGRSTTSSTILYLDGKERGFHDIGCSGTQSSRQLDSRTVEILRICASGARTRFVRRLSTGSRELVLEITEQQPDGQRLERRLVLDRQIGTGMAQHKQSEDERRKP